MHTYTTLVPCRDAPQRDRRVGSKMVRLLDDFLLKVDSSTRGSIATLSLRGTTDHVSSLVVIVLLM
jgi:hypothetical protein